MPVPAPSPSQHIGPNVKRFRLSARFTQLALAHAIGYRGDDAGAYISRIEAGDYEPRLDNLARIAEQLGVTVELLISKPKKA